MRIVVHTADVVGVRMAGPGIRAWHFARELAKVAPTALVAQFEEPEPAPFRLLQLGSEEAKRALRDADVLLGQPKRGFFRRRRGQKVVFDLFDPVVLELRELYGTWPSLRQRIHVGAEWGRLAFALRHADLLVCAARKQREFYERLQSGDAPWIEVPFGVDDGKPAGEDGSPRENIVLWGGGVWEWLDPKTAVEAVVHLNREGLPCRLLFLGRTRPNRELVDRRREDRFSQLLAAGAPYVSSNDRWIPYRERLSWLERAKVAIMLHRPTAEAEYSIRTRLFDAIAAGVPVVTTEKGFAAELVEGEGLGIVVPPSDAAAVAEAIRKLLTDDTFHARCVLNLERIRPRFSWDVVTRPLVDNVTEWLKQRV